DSRDKRHGRRPANRCGREGARLIAHQGTSVEGHADGTGDDPYEQRDENQSATPEHHGDNSTQSLSRSLTVRTSLGSRRTFSSIAPSRTLDPVHRATAARPQLPESSPCGILDQRPSLRLPPVSSVLRTTPAHPPNPSGVASREGRSRLHPNSWPPAARRRSRASDAVSLPWRGAQRC